LRQLKSLWLLVALAAMTLSIGGCKKPPIEDDSNVYGGRRVHKLNDQLHLAIGSFELEEASIDKATFRAKIPNPPPPVLGFSSMRFFVPGESHLKYPDRYSKQDMSYGQDANVVTVWRIESEPPRENGGSWLAREGAKAFWEYLFKSRLQSGERPEKILDMSCYRDTRAPVSYKEYDCYAARPSGEYALIEMDNADSGKYFPTIGVRYFTKAYGGMRIEWRAHISQASKWKEIDEKMWRLIDRWNVAPGVN